MGLLEQYLPTIVIFTAIIVVLVIVVKWLMAKNEYYKEYYKHYYGHDD